MSEVVKPEFKTFYEYVTTPYWSSVLQKEYPLSAFGTYVKRDEYFPKGSNDKNEIYGYLKDIDVTEQQLKDFLFHWNQYKENDPAPREVRKQAWEEKCAERKKEETYLIEHYVNDIRNLVNYYDQTFEEKEQLERRREERWGKGRAENLEFFDKLAAESEFLHKKPEGMANEEYIKRKRQIRARRAEENKEAKVDRTIKCIHLGG